MSYNDVTFSGIYAWSTRMKFMCQTIARTHTVYFFNLYGIVMIILIHQMYSDPLIIFAMEVLFACCMY